MIKIGLCLAVLCTLTACQDVKKAQHSASESQVDDTEQKQPASTVQMEGNTASSQPSIEAKIDTNIEATPTASQIPKVVQDYVKELQQNCKAQEKTALKDAVRLIDVWGDADPEYLIEADDLRCYEYASDRGNGGGRDLALFATLEHGQTKKILDHVMFDYRIDVTAPKSRIYLELGGGFCGQNMDEISRSEAISCERLLEWDAKSQQLILGEMFIPAAASSVQTSSAL